MNRRRFVADAHLGSGAALALGARMATASAQGANNRIRIGVIGTGGRARGLMAAQAAARQRDGRRLRRL